MSKELHTKLSDEEWEKLEKRYSKETESIDNANPSEALECLEELRFTVIAFCKASNKQEAYCEELCDTIKQALTTKSKKEQAFYKISNLVLEYKQDIKGCLGGAKFSMQEYYLSKIIKEVE